MRDPVGRVKYAESRARDGGRVLRARPGTVHLGEGRVSPGFNPASFGIRRLTGKPRRGGMIEPGAPAPGHRGPPETPPAPKGRHRAGGAMPPLRGWRIVDA